MGLFSRLFHPVYLHFEDWSQFTDFLTQKGMPHGDRIIKVKASLEDPRDTFEKKTLEVLRYSGGPFKKEIFDFGERGIYSGVAVEQYMEERCFTETGKRVARALFRFAVQPEAGYVQRAMAFKRGDRWLIDHPMEDLDGLAYASRTGQEGRIHLDIFYPDSLEALKGFVNIDDPSQIMSLREYRDYERKVYLDYQQRRGKERE